MQEGLENNLTCCIITGLIFHSHPAGRWVSRKNPEAHD